MGKLLTSHRSTIYPCFLPDLGDSTGAGRIRLTRHKGKQVFGFANSSAVFFVFQSPKDVKNAAGKGFWLSLGD